MFLFFWFHHFLEARGVIGKNILLLFFGRIECKKLHVDFLFILFNKNGKKKDTFWKLLTCTEHKCCPDNFTPAEGPNYKGCQCHTYKYGCCPDGVRIARGPGQV